MEEIWLLIFLLYTGDGQTSVVIENDHLYLTETKCEETGEKNKIQFKPLEPKIYFDYYCVVEYINNYYDR